MGVVPYAGGGGLLCADLGALGLLFDCSIAGVGGRFRFPQFNTPMRPNKRRGFTLIELLTVIAIIGILAGVLFPAIGSVKKKSKIATSQTTFSQWCSAVSRYKSVYGFYPNIANEAGSAYDTKKDSPFQLDLTNTGTRFVQCLSGKYPSGKILESSKRVIFNRNAEEFCAFAKDDFDAYDDKVDASGRLVDKFGNYKIRVIFDTDNTGSIKSVSTLPALPEELKNSSDVSGIDGTVGIPARVIIFTTKNEDPGSITNDLTKDDVADIVSIQ